MMDGTTTSSAIPIDYEAVITSEGTTVSTPSSVEFTVLNQQGSTGATSKVMLSYIPYQMTEIELKELCETKGSLISFRLVRCIITGSRKGYAFAEFSNNEEAIKACRELNGLKLWDKYIKVHIARANTDAISQANLHIADVPSVWTIADLYNYFRCFGNIITCKLLLDEFRANRGIGFVRFATKSEASNARAYLHGIIPEGETKKLIISVAHGNGPNSVHRNAVSIPVPTTSNVNSDSNVIPIPTSSDIQTPTSSTTSSPSSSILKTTLAVYPIFVQNLKADCEPSFLMEMFGKYGNIHSIKIEPGTPSGKWSAIVNMTDGSQAFDAVYNLNGINIGPNQKLTVSVKNIRNRNDST